MTPGLPPATGMAGRARLGFSGLIVGGLMTAALTGSAALAQDSTSISFGIRDYFKVEAEAIIEAYKAVAPDVTVELRLLPTDEVGYRQQVLASRLADDLPDVLAIYDTIVEEFAGAEVTTDLTPFLESTGLEFAPAFLDAYRVIGGPHDGELHGLPQGADAIVLYYNKALFDEAGIAYPDDTWTYDDLLTAARALTKKDGDTTTQWGFTTWYEWQAMYQPMTLSFGGDIVSADGTTATLDSPAALQAFHALLDPVKEGIFVPEDAQATQGNYIAPFSSGAAAMFAGVRAHIPLIRPTMTDDWDVAQFPMVNGQRNVGSGSVGLAVTSLSQNREAAEAFLQWYFSEDGGMKILASQYAVVPPIVDLYDSPIWRDLPAPPANNDAFIQAIETGVLSPPIPLASAGGFNDAVIEAAQKVLVGGVSVEQAFAEANVKANEALQKAE